MGQFRVQIMRQSGSLLDANQHTTITAADLGQFVQVCAEVSPRLQDMFGIGLQTNFGAKPMEQLGKILRLMGLSLERLPAKKVNKKKIYPYRISREDWDTASHYVNLRKPRDRGEIGFVRRKAEAGSSLAA